MIKIARIDGDGIGKEVTEAGVAVLESLDLNLKGSYRSWSGCFRIFGFELRFHRS